MQNPITYKVYYEKNRDRILSVKKDYYKKRKEVLGDQLLQDTRKWRQDNPESYLFSNAKSHAKQRNIEFNLTKEDIKIPDMCPVLGIPISINMEWGKSDNSPSIDRLDSSKGYTKDNINVISWRANNLKKDGSLEEFKKLVFWLENGKRQDA